MTTKSLKIEGMTCAACAKAVERVTKKLRGGIGDKCKFCYRKTYYKL